MSNSKTQRFGLVFEVVLQQCYLHIVNRWSCYAECFVVANSVCALLEEELANRTLLVWKMWVNWCLEMRKAMGRQTCMHSNCWWKLEIPVKCRTLVVWVDRGFVWDFFTSLLVFSYFFFSPRSCEKPDLFLCDQTDKRHSLLREKRLLCCVWGYLIWRKKRGWGETLFSTAPWKEVVVKWVLESEWQDKRK